MESLKIKSNARKSTYSGKPNAANQEHLRMRQAFRPEPNANHIPVKSSSTTWKRSGWSLSARARRDSKEELLTPMVIRKDNEGRLDIASSNRDVSDGSANDENVATSEKKSPDQRSLWSLFSTPKPQDSADENASQLGTISNGSSRVHDEKLTENHVKKSPPQDPRIRKREEPETKKSPPSFNLFSKMKPLRNASRNLFAHLGKKPDVPINQETSAISVTPTQSGDVEIAKKADNHDQNYTRSSANLKDNNMQSLFGRLSEVSSDAERCSVSNQKQSRDSPVAEDVTSEISGSTTEEGRPSMDRTMPTLTLPADIGQEDVKSNMSSEQNESECLFIDEQASADCPSDIDEDSGKTKEEEEGSHVLRVWSLQSEEETNSHIQNVDYNSSFSGDASSFLDESLPLTGDESLNSLERFITENTVGLGDIGDENSDSVSKSSGEKTLETTKAAQRNAGGNDQMIRNFEEGPPKLQAQPNTHHLLQELDSLLECSTLQSEPHPSVQPESDEEMSDVSSLDHSRESDNSNIAEPARNIFSLFGGGKKSSSPSNNVELLERQFIEQSANSSYRSAFSKDAIIQSGSCSGERDSLAKRERPNDSSAGNTKLNKESPESGLQTVSSNLPHVAPVFALSSDESADTSLLTPPITESKDTCIPSLTPEIGTGEEQGNEQNLQSNQPPELSLEVNPSSSFLCEKEVSRPSSVVPVPEEDDVEDISFLAFESRNDLCSYSKTMKLKMQRKTAQTSKAPAKKCVYPVVKNVKMKKKKKNPIEARIKALEQDLLLSMESRGLTEIVHPVLSRKGVALDTVKKNDLFVNVRNEELERISVPHRSKKSKHKKKHRSRTEVRPPFHLKWPVKHSSPLKISRSKHRHSSTLLVKNSMGDRDHGRNHVRKPEPGHYANTKMNPTTSSDPVKVVGLEHGQFPGSQKYVSKVKGIDVSDGKMETKRSKPKHSSKSQEWEIFSSEAPTLSERPSLKLKFKAKMTSPTKVEQSPLALSTKPRQSTVPLKSSSSHIPVNVQQLHVPSATTKSVALLAPKKVEEKVQPSRLPSTSTQAYFLIASKQSTSTNRFVPIAPKAVKENVRTTVLPSTTTKRPAPVAPKLVEEQAQPARPPEEESRPFKPFEKPVASKKSAFVSDALEDLLQGAGMNKQMKPLISPSTMSVSNAKVVYKVPSKQSHSVKTLDMALRRQKPVNVSAHTSDKAVLGFRDSHHERNEMKKKKKKKKNKHKDRPKEEKVKQGYVFGTGPGDLVRKLPNLPFSCYGKTVARPLFARQQQVSNTVGEKSEGFLEVRNVLSLSTKRYSDEVEVQAVKKIKQEPEEIDENVSHIDDNLQPILNINLPGSGKDEILSKEEKNNECVESLRKENQSSSGTNEVKKCGEYCRLGCICSSINDSRTVQERSSHCRKVDCMFDCVCKRISTQNTSSTRIRRPPTFAQDMLFYDDSYKIWKYGDKESSTSEIKKLQLLDHLPATEKRNLVSTCARTRLFVTDKPEKWIKRKRKEQEDKTDKHHGNKRPSEAKVGHHLALEGSGVHLSNQNQAQQNESRVDNKQHKSSGKQGFIPLSVPSGIKHQNANQSGTVKTVPAQSTATLSRSATSSQGNAVTPQVMSTFLPIAKQYLLNGNIMNMVLLPNGNRILVPATAVPKVINTIGTSLAGKKAQQPKPKCDNSTSSVTTGLQKPALPVRYQITSSGIAISPAPVALVVPAEKSKISQGTISVAKQSNPGMVQTPSASTKPKVHGTVSLSGDVTSVSSTKTGSDIQHTVPPTCKLKSSGLSTQPSGIIPTSSAATNPKVPVTVSLSGGVTSVSSTKTGSDIQHTVPSKLKSPGVSAQPSGIIQTPSASTNPKAHVTVNLLGDVALVSSTKTGSDIQHIVPPKVKSPGVSAQPSGMVHTSTASTNPKVPVIVSLSRGVTSVSSTKTGSDIQHTVSPKLKSPGVSAQPSGIIQTPSASTSSKVHVTVSLTGDVATLSSTRTGSNSQHTVAPKLKSPGVSALPSGIIQSPSASTNSKVHATVSISGGVATISSTRTGSDIRHTVAPKLNSPGVSAQPSVLVKPPDGVKAPTVTIYKNNSVDCKSPPAEAMKPDSDIQKKHPAKKHESPAKSASHKDKEEPHSPPINDILGDYESNDMRITKTFFANFGDKRVYFMISTDTDFQWTHLSECVVNQAIKFFFHLDKPEGSIYTFRDIHINLLSKNEDVIRLSLTLEGPSKKTMEKVSQRSESTYSNREDIAEDEPVMGHGKEPTCSNKENLKGDDQILKTKAHISNQEHNTPVDAQNSYGGGTLRPLASTIGPRDSIATPLTTGDKKQMKDKSSNITKVAATSHASDDHEQTVTPIKTQMTLGKSRPTSEKPKSTPNTPDKALSSSDGKLSSSLPEFAKLSEIVKRNSLDEDNELSPTKKITRNASEWLQDPTIKKSLDMQRYSGVRTPWFRTEKEGVKVVLQRDNKKRPLVGKGGKSPAKTKRREMLKRPSASSSVDICAKESSKHVECVVLENPEDGESKTHEGDVLDHGEISVEIIKMQLCEDGLSDGDKSEDSKTHKGDVHVQDDGDIPAHRIKMQLCEDSSSDREKSSDSKTHKSDVQDDGAIPAHRIKMQLCKDSSSDGEKSSDSKTHKGDVQDDGAIPAHRIKMQLCDDSLSDGEKPSHTENHTSDSFVRDVESNAKDSESTQIDDNCEDPVGSSKNPATGEERMIDGQGEQQNTGIAVMASSPKTTSPRTDVSVEVGMEAEKEIGIEDAEGTLGIEHFARFSEEDDYGHLDFDEEMPASFDLTAGYEDDSSSIASLKIDEDIDNDVTDAHIGKSNLLPEEFVKELPESPEVTGNAQPNFQLPTDTNIDATGETMSRANIIACLEDQVHLFSDVIKESPSRKDIKTESTPVKNHDIYPKKSPMLSIKFVATSNENCTSRVCTSPLSEVLSENTQGTSPSPSKSNSSSEDGLSDTDMPSTKADGPPEAGVSNTEMVLTKCIETSETRLSNTEIVPPKSIKTSKTRLSTTETVPTKSIKTSEARLSNTEKAPPKSIETSEPRLSNTEKTLPKSIETSKARLSNTEIVPPKSTETSEVRLSNTENVPPKSFETSEPRLSNTEIVPPKSTETSEVRLSNTENVPPKSFEASEPRLSNTELVPPKSFETYEVRLSNTENVPPKSIETSETRLSNTEIAPPKSTDPAQEGMSCTKTLKSDNQSEASLPNTAIVPSKANEPSEASLLDTEMSSAKGNDLSGASLSNKEKAQTKSNDISKDNLLNKDIDSANTDDDVILLNTEMGPTKGNDLPEADLSDIEIDVVNTDDDDVEIDVETVSGSTQNVQNIDPYSSLRDITSRLSSALQKEQAADVPKKSKHRSSTSSSITLGLRMGSPRKITPQIVRSLSWRKDSQSSSTPGQSKKFGRKLSPETSKQKDSRSLSTHHHHVKAKKKKSKRKSPVCPTKQWESPMFQVVYKDSSAGEESSEGKSKRNLINHNILERKRREELRKAFTELSNEIQERTDLKAPSKITILKQATDLVSKLKDTEKKLLKKEEQLRTDQRRLVYVHSNLLHHARCSGQIVFPEGSKLAESMDRIRTGLSHVVTSASQGGKDVKDVKEYVSKYVQSQGAKRKAESSKHNLGKAHNTVQKKESGKATFGGSSDKAMKHKRQVSSSSSHSEKKKSKERKKSLKKYIRHLPVTRKDMQTSLGSSDSAGVDTYLNTGLKGNQGTSETASFLPSGSQVISQSRFGPYHAMEDESDEESLPIDCYVSSSDEQEEDEVDFGWDDDEQYSDDGFILESEDENNAKADDKRGALSDEESKADNSDREIVNFNMDLDDFEHGTADSRSDIETGSEVESRKRPMPKFRQISQRKEKSSLEGHDSDDDVLVISEEPLGTGDMRDKEQKERGKLGSQDSNTVGESSKFLSQSKAMNIPKQDTVTKKVQSIPSVLKTTPSSEMSSIKVTNSTKTEVDKEQDKAPLVNVIDEIMNRLKGDAPPSPVSSVEEMKTNKVMGPSSVGLGSNDENKEKVKSTSTKQISTTRTSTVPLGASNFSAGNELNSQKRTSVLAVGGVALSSFKHTEGKVLASSVKPKGDVKPCDVMLDSSESSSDDESTTVATSKSIQQEERNVSAISRKHKDDVQPNMVVLDDSDSSSDDETTTAATLKSSQQEERNASALSRKNKDDAQPTRVLLENSDSSSDDESTTAALSNSTQQDDRNASAISRKPKDVQPSRVTLDDSDTSSDDEMPSTSYSKDSGGVSNNTPLVAENNPVASPLKKTRVLPMKGALADLISSVKTRVENDDARDLSDDSDIEGEAVSEDEDSDDESNDEESSDYEKKEEEETKENIVANDESASNDGENEKQDITLINKDAAGPSSISGETDQQEDIPVLHLAGSSSSAGRKEEERENLASNIDDEAVTGPTVITKFQQGYAVGEDSTDDDDDAACLSYAAMGNDEDNEALFDADDRSLPFSPISLDMNIASDDDISDSFDDPGDAVKSSIHLPSKTSATVASTSIDETKPRETSSQAEQSSEAHQTPSASSKPDLTLDEAISFLNVEKNSDGTLNVFLKGDYNDEKLGELFEKPEVMDYIMTAAAKKD